jgi:hypothetical protein
MSLQRTDLAPGLFRVPAIGFVIESCQNLTGFDLVSFVPEHF